MTIPILAKISGNVSASKEKTKMGNPPFKCEVFRRILFLNKWGRF